MPKRRTSATFFLSLALVTVAAFSGPVKLNVQAVTWSAGTSLTPLLNIEGKPYVIQDSQNKLWLTYESSRSGNFDIYIRTFASGSWASEQRLTNSSSFDLAPSLAQLSNGNILLVWSSDRSGTYALWQKTYSGGSWTAESQLTFPTGRDANPALLRLGNETVWLFWSRETISGQTVLRNLYYKSLNNGVWSSDQQFSTGNSEQQPNLQQLDDGTVFVTYAANRLGNLDIYYRKLTGPTWSAETPLTTNANDDRQSWLMQDSNNLLYFFWTRCVPAGGQNCQDDIFYKTSSNRGATWSAEVVFTVDPQGETIADSHPTAILAKDHMIYVFWGTNLTGPGTDFDIYVSTSDHILSHDVGVVKMVATPYVLRPGTTVSIKVTVTNYGDYPETVQVTVTATNTSSISLGTQTASLSVAASTNLTFTWNTAGVHFGKYIVTSSIPPVTGEPAAYQSDNTLSLNGARVLTPADVNMDGKVDILDGALLGFSYGTSGPSPLWDPRTDLDGDGAVTIVDAATLAFAYGTTPGQPRWNPGADVDKNGAVDIVDAALLAYAYGTKGPDPLWNPMADIDGDGKITILDAALVAFYYGTII